MYQVWPYSASEHRVDHYGGGPVMCVPETVCSARISFTPLLRRGFKGGTPTTRQLAPPWPHIMHLFLCVSRTLAKSSGLMTPLCGFIRPLTAVFYPRHRVCLGTFQSRRRKLNSTTSSNRAGIEAAPFRRRHDWRGHHGH